MGLLKTATITVKNLSDVTLQVSLVTSLSDSLPEISDTKQMKCTVD